MPSPLALLLVLASLQSSDAVRIRVVSGVVEAGAIPPAAIGLGSGGLMHRERWRATRAGARGSVTTAGGARITAAASSVDVRLPSGQRLAVDGLARLTGDGRRLTAPALHGLALRLHDGSELRVWPGNARTVREATLVTGAVEILLLRNGRPLNGRRRSRPFWGPRYYVAGAGDEVVALTAFGPCVFVRSVARRGVAPRSEIVVLGDLIRDAVTELAKRSPRRSAQFPLAARHAAVIRDAVARVFPARRRIDEAQRSERRLGFVFATGDEMRWTLERRKGTDQVVFGLHLAPDAPPSLEFVSARTKTTLQRVLPLSRRQRSRYLGRGIPIDTNTLLPWPLPLAAAGQRAKALKLLAPFVHEAKPDK